MLSNTKLEEILAVSDYEKFQKEKQELLKLKGPMNCMLCTTKKVQVAIYECLNCENTYMCEGCKQKHLKNPRYKLHKVSPFQPVAQSDDNEEIVKVDDQQCPLHFQKYRLYCYTDEKPLCLRCTESTSNEGDDSTQIKTSSGPEELHMNHFVKSISSVLE